MDDRLLLHLIDEPPPERADAARNRALLLDTARQLVDRCGVEGLTMDALAHEAGVGKGTVFRRFDSRAGLMASLLDHTEKDWQARVIGGPPPLGPGAPPLERLLAFGRSRLDQSLLTADLIEAAGVAHTRNYAPYAFAAMHVRYLLGELGVQGDIALLATALLAPLELPILKQQVQIERMGVARIMAGWEDLVRRVIGDAAPA